MPHRTLPAHDLLPRIVACNDLVEAEAILKVGIEMGKRAVVANAREAAREAMRLSDGDVALAAAAFRLAVLSAIPLNPEDVA